MEPNRIDPLQARSHIAAGSLLVCAYDDPDRCMQNHLEGAINMQELADLEDRLPTDHEIIFYCA